MIASDNSPPRPLFAGGGKGSNCALLAIASLLGLRL